MNTKILTLAPIALLLVGGLTNCNEQNTPTTPKAEIVAKPKALQLDADTLKVVVGEETTARVLDGGGEYRAFSENPEIATVAIEGQTLKLTGKSGGVTSVVLSDKANQYKRFPVSARYGKIVLEKSEVRMAIKLGHVGRVQYVKVTEGNGEYSAVSDNESIVRIQYVRDGVIALNPVAAGEASVTVTDAMGLTTTLKVVIESVSAMYTDEEKEDLKKVNRNELFFAGRDMSYELNYGSPSFRILNGRPTFRYNRGRSNTPQQVFFNLSFDGDFTEGVKQNPQVSYKMQYVNAFTFPNPTVEVIKATEDRVWIVFSQIIRNKVEGGYLIYTRPNAN